MTITRAKQDDSLLLFFGNAVKKVRLAHGMSQEELAFKAKLDRTYISGIERGTRNPSLCNLHRLAIALNTPLSALIQGVEDSLSGV